VPQVMDTIYQRAPRVSVVLTSVQLQLPITSDDFDGNCDSLPWTSPMRGRESRHDGRETDAFARSASVLREADNQCAFLSHAARRMALRHCTAHSRSASEHVGFV